MTKTNTYNNYCNLAATTLYVDNYEQSTANGVTTTYDAADRLTGWTISNPGLFDELAIRRYNDRYDDGRLLSPKETNPFFFDYTENRLKNPYLY